MIKIIKRLFNNRIKLKLLARIKGTAEIGSEKC